MLSYLYIIIENKMRWAIFIQKFECIMIREIFKLKKKGIIKSGKQLVQAKTKSLKMLNQIYNLYKNFLPIVLLNRVHKLF
jgi:hypothetical protein